jgi:prepilin-type N-terminal cleavage/methylation domain-containing protein
VVRRLAKRGSGNQPANGFDDELSVSDIPVVIGLRIQFHSRSRRPGNVRRGRARSGFTLIECSLAMVIIGVGVVSSVRLFSACSQENRTSNQMTTAMLLTSHIREAMVGLSFNDPISGQNNFGYESGETLPGFNDIDDFDGQTFNPPIDSLHAQIPSMSQYSQVVSVVPVFPNKLNSNTNDVTPEIPKTTYTGAVRVRVRIYYRAQPADPAQEVYRASWVRLDN